MKFLIYFLLFFGILISFFFDTQAIKKEISKEDKSKIENYLNLVKKYQQTNQINEASRCLNMLAFLYWEYNHFQKAAKYYEESNILNRQLKNISAITRINNNLGLIYFDMQKYDQSLDRFVEVLTEYRKEKKKAKIIDVILNMVLVFAKQNKNHESIKYLNEALSYSIELNDEERIKNIHGTLAEVYRKVGDRKQTAKHYTLYRKFTEKTIKNKEQEKIETESRLKEIEQEKRIKDTKLEQTTSRLIEIDQTSKSLIDSLNKKELAYLLLRKEKQEIEMNKRLQEEKNKSEIQKHQNHIITLRSISVIILLILLFGAYIIFKIQKDNKLLSQKNAEIFKAQQEILFQKEKLELAVNEIHSKNKNITASINYAKRIQTSIMDSFGLLTDILEDAFIFFQPKDIVSGDFFWFREIDNKIVIACVDCTGHGVPGAFISIMGINLLNQIVNNEKITDPGKILDSLDTKVHDTLNLNRSVDELQDGMNASILTFDKKLRKLSYAGAKHALVYIENQEIKEIKGTRNTIGGRTKYKIDDSYTSTEVPFNSQIKYYIFTDGFADQFGDDNKGKFMVKNLKNMFLEISNKSFEIQKAIMETTLKNWKGNTKQTDDILIIGTCFS